MRVVFLGTPEFAVPSFEALRDAGHQMAAVFTQPDRPKGRGGQIAESAVKLAAVRAGIPVYQPERIRRPENLELLRGFAPDLMVVVGYGQIIPQAIIDLPQHGILNVHASLLPRYRGAAPIQWAIASGEKQTGVTIMRIDAGLDTGDMLLKGALDIGPEETAAQLSSRLAPMGASLLVHAIALIQHGRDFAEKQDNEAATLAPILKKEDGLISWTRTAGEIFHRLRGFSPWPGAYTYFRGQQLSVLDARPVESTGRLAEGALAFKDKKLFVGCGQETVLELLDVQPAGKKRMSAEAFGNGHKFADAELLGGRS